MLSSTAARSSIRSFLAAAPSPPRPRGSYSSSFATRRYPSPFSSRPFRSAAFATEMTVLSSSSFSSSSFGPLPFRRRRRCRGRFDGCLAVVVGDDDGGFFHRGVDVRRRSFATARQKREAAARAAREGGGGGGEGKARPLGTPSTGLVRPGFGVGAATTTTNPASAAPLPPPSLIRTDVDPRTNLNLVQRPDDDDRTPSSSDLRTPPPSSPSLVPDPSGVSRADPSDVIDFSTMYDPSVHLPDKPDFADPNLNYEPSTPLSDELIKLIGVRGPITVAEYMRMALGHGEYGYYARGGERDSREDDDDDLFDDDDHDDDGDLFDDEGDARGADGVIGPKGDFTTAPEISQIFGECLTVWLVTQWEAMKKPSAIQIVEIGPGKGTLISDVLRSATTSFGGSDGGFGEAIANGGGVHLVEIGRGMRSKQRERLAELGEELRGEGWSFEFDDWTEEDAEEDYSGDEGGKLGDVREGAAGEATTTAGDDEGDAAGPPAPPTDREDAPAAVENDADAKRTIHVRWHDRFSSVPSSLPSSSSSSSSDDDEKVPTFVICQELFDALPVHVFQKTEEGWRERLVDVAIRDDDANAADENDTNAGGKVNKSEAPRIGRRYVDADEERRRQQQSSSDEKRPSLPPSDDDAKRKKPRLRFVLPPDTTRAVRTLLRVDASGNATAQETSALDDSEIGDVLEVRPEGSMLIQDVARTIDVCGGAALIVDYGDVGVGDTLRAFRKHGQVHALSAPGKADVTSDVDFGALRDAVNYGLADVPRGRTTDPSSVSDDDDNRTAKATETETKERKAAAERDPNPVRAFGPVTQGRFLSAMGATERVIRLVERDDTTDEQAEVLCDALERLVTKEHMGERYKVLGIARRKEGVFDPPGF